MNKNLKILAGIIIIILIIWGISSMNKKDSGNLNLENETIKIGLISPLSGPLAYLGEPILESFDLYYSENDNYEIIVEDGKCDTKTALSAGNKLIFTDKIDLLISGVCSNSTLTLEKIAKDNGILIFTPISASSKLSGVGEHFARISSPTSISSVKTAEVLKEKGFKNIVVMFENIEYPKGAKNDLVKSFEDENHKILSVESFGYGQTDLKTQALSATLKKPDAIIIFSISPTTANPLVNEIRTIDENIPIIGNEVFMSSQIIEKDVNQGVNFISYHHDAEGQKFSEFKNLFFKKYEKQIQQIYYGAAAYDLANLVDLSFKKCGLDNECISDYFYSLENFDGVSGKISINEDGDAERDFSLFKIEDKKYKLVQ